MEAPEKIYLNPALDALTEALSEKTDDDIEYTRTDAFIEKAENFFTEKFNVEDYNDIIDVDGSPIFNYGRFIDDFVKFMKGG